MCRFRTIRLISSPMYTSTSCKGIVAGTDGKWIHFDFVPEELNIRYGSADVTGKLCVIGSKLDEAAIAKIFGL